MILNIKEFFNKDIIELVKKSFAKIDEIDKKTFLWIFVALNVMFIFHTINFLFGNHDWWAIKDGVQWDTFFFNGRFSATAIKMILLNGQVLPILNNLIAFFFYALGSVLLLNYWNAPKNILQRVLIGFVLTLTPFTNVWLWFAYHTIENLSIPFFVTLGLILTIKNFDNIYCAILQKVLSVVFLTLALGIYPSAIVNILTIFSCKFLLDNLSDGIFEFKRVFLKHKWSFINIALSFISYKLILLYMGYKNLLADVINIQSAGIEQILQNILPAMKAAFQQMFNYRFICMPQNITILFAVLFVLLILFGIYNVLVSKSSKIDKLKKIIIYSILALAPLFATKVASILALKNVFYSIRIDIYGLVFLRGMIVLLLFKYGNNFIKNITYLLVVAILWISLIANFVCQKSLKLAHTSEFMRMNRMIQELYLNKDFVKGKGYKLISIGYPKPLRPKYIPQKYKRKAKPDVSMGSHTLIPEWDPLVVLEFFVEEDFICDKKVYVAHEETGELLINTLGENELKFLKKALPRTSLKDSENIQIIDDTIVCVFSEKSLEKVRDRCLGNN